MHAHERAALRADINGVAMRVILADDERELLRMLEIDVGASCRRVADLSANRRGR
jgi:hypothetical protein